MSKCVYYLAPLLLLIVACAPKKAEYISSEVTPTELQQHIKFLASDELGGRKSGEEGNRKAAEYIAEQFRDDGLRPVGDNGDYFQSFPFVASTKPGERNSLTLKYHGKLISLKRDEDFRPFSFSSDTSITAPLVFAGYGISSDSLNYDDYKGIDVKNKIVVVLRYSPEGSGDNRFTQYSSFMSKAYTARDKGAAGILYVSASPGSEGDALMPFMYPIPFRSSIAAEAVKWNFIDSVFSSLGKNLSLLKQEIDTTKQPHSQELDGVTASLETQVIKVYAKSANILGYLEGGDPALKDELVVVGAHMDHLGFGGQGSGSLSPDTVAVHHGADDNASGTAGLLELAQYFSTSSVRPKRSLLFIAFSGEELGLFGSEYYVKNPIFPLEKTITMVNMDMIGRLKDSLLVVEGVSSAAAWDSLLWKENSDSSFKLKLKPDGFGPSDHSSFYGKNIPVLFFFTNLHGDYHRPSDTWDKINYPGEQRVVQYVSRIVNDVANVGVRPEFKKGQPMAMQSGGDRQGVRVSLGVVPDYAEDDNGLKISGTRPGSAAEKAGLLGGDIIIKFDDKDVKSIYDFTYLLGKYKAGDHVMIVVKRNGKEVSLPATLEARK